MGFFHFQAYCSKISIKSSIEVWRICFGFIQGFKGQKENMLIWRSLISPKNSRQFSVEEEDSVGKKYLDNTEIPPILFLPFRGIDNRCKIKNVSMHYIAPKAEGGRHLHQCSFRNIDANVKQDLMAKLISALGKSISIQWRKICNDFHFSERKTCFP